MRTSSSLTLAIALAASGCASQPAPAPAPAPAPSYTYSERAPREAPSDSGGWRAPARPVPRDDVGPALGGGEADMDRKLDGQKISVNFDQTPLDEAINFIRDVTGLNVAISSAAQERLDAEHPKVTLRLRDISVRNAIYHVLGADEQLVCEVRPDMLVVNSKDTVKKKSVTTFYDVSDIIDSRPDYVAPTMGLPDGKGKKNTGAIVDFGKDDEKKNRGTGLDKDKLVEVVQKLAGEDAAVELVGGQLMVRTTEAAHARIAAELEGRRR
jgi:hypothetical protein